MPESIVNALEQSQWKSQRMLEEFKRAAGDSLDIMSAGNQEYIEFTRTALENVIQEFRKTQSNFFTLKTQDCAKAVIDALNVNMQTRFSSIDARIDSLMEEKADPNKWRSVARGEGGEKEIFFKVRRGSEKGGIPSDWIEFVGEGGNIELRQFTTGTMIGTWFEMLFLGKSDSSPLPDISMNGVPTVEAKTYGVTQGKATIGDRSLKYLKFADPKIEKQFTDLYTAAITILAILEKAHNLLLMRTWEDTTTHSTNWIRFKFVSAFIYGKLKVDKILGNFFIRDSNNPMAFIPGSTDHPFRNSNYISSLARVKPSEKPINGFEEETKVTRYPQQTKTQPYFSITKHMQTMTVTTSILIDTPTVEKYGKGGVKAARDMADAVLGSQDSIYAEAYNLLDDPAAKYAFYTAMLDITYGSDKINVSDKVARKVYENRGVWRRKI